MRSHSALETFGDSVNAAEMKHQSEGMCLCVLYSCFYCAVYQCGAPRKQKLCCQSNENRDLSNEDMSQSLLLALNGCSLFALESKL